MRKPVFPYRKTKAQIMSPIFAQLILRADQSLCFPYIDSTPALLLMASTHMLWLYSQVCVGPGNEAAHKMQKWGFTQYTLFLFALKHRMWVLIKTSIRNLCFAQTLKTIYIKILHMKIVIFTVAKITV